MSNVKLPVAVCAVVAEVLNGSHNTLETLFLTAGAPGPPPNLAHQSKWKIWLQQIGNDPNVDSLYVLGNIIEEFMDLPPQNSNGSVSKLFDTEIEINPLESYNNQKERLVNVLEEHGFRYFRGGRVIPVGEPDPEIQTERLNKLSEGMKPASIEEVLRILIRGLPRAMQPLIHRRKNSQCLSFSTEYDIQDLLHSLLRPWIADIRPEEFSPSYAGSNTRMDFLLPDHNLVIETKKVRDKHHAKNVGDELIIDIEHYRKHPKSDHLWCVIYDPDLYISNPNGMITDLEGDRSTPDGKIKVKVIIVSTGI